MAAWLVTQLPGEDCRRRFVAVDDEGDISLIGFLSRGVRVEGRSITAEDIAVGVDTAEVVPIVEHCQDELEFESLPDMSQRKQ